MKSDLTRFTFDQAKHYRAVQQQQGRVQLDADWNEQLDITGHRIETESIDSIGRCGAPLHDDGFRLIATAAALTADEAARSGNQNPPAVPAGDLLLTAGRLYAGGVLTENDAITLISAQPDLPTAAQLAKLGTLGTGRTLLPSAPGTYLAYLDVWPRLRTALDDPRMREVALGGPDTATRIKNAWQVKFLPAAAGDDCASANASWEALLHPRLGTLAASVAATASKKGPCIVEPGSGYRRLENQLYRVEVHSGGDTLAKTSFKWSRDNGSIVTRWISKQPLSDELEVESTGRDKVLAIAPGHWVELSDDSREELGVPGTFALVTKVSGNLITIDSAGASGPIELDAFPKNPKVRRWDSVSTKPGKWFAPDGEKTLNSVDKFELEDGVVVQFGPGAFRTGDYWLIPARTALPFVEWPRVANTPQPLAPQGVEHHFCKLAIVELKAGSFTISDCRKRFPALTELVTLAYVSGEGQEATPDPTRPSTTLLPLALPLEVGVANGGWPVAGARVRFHVQAGAGALTPAGGIVFTDVDGIAKCHWSIDSASANQEVIAELLDDADARVHLPILFHARLNTAARVSYNPEKCQGMKQATPAVITVQDAIDFLCRDKAAVDCCVTIGKLKDHPGDYGTVAEAIEDLLQKRRYASICLTLLPGDHPIDDQLMVTPVDGKEPTHVRIVGCSQAARLILRAPLTFLNLEAVVIRDITIVMEGSGVLFDRCRQVEVGTCVIHGLAGKAALLQAGGVSQFSLANSRIRVGEAAGEAPGRIALALLDVDADSVLVDNRIHGTVSLGGLPAQKVLNEDERQKLASQIKAGRVEITASRGKLQLRGNTIKQITVGENLLVKLLKLIEAGGSLSVWASTHYSDNVIHYGDNVFLARHLSLSTTRFLELKTDLGMAIAHSAVYLGNSADQDVRLFSLGASAMAANQGINIVI